MILDATMFALAEIASSESRLVAILPGMRIDQIQKVRISHPGSEYELRLSGKVDYAVLEYKDNKDTKGESHYHILFLCELLHSFLSPLALPWWI